MALAVAAAATGCAPFDPLPPLTCPNRGGPPFTELTTRHLLLRTDLPAAEARALSADVERGYDLLEAVLRRELGAAADAPHPVDRVRLTVFRREVDMAAIHARSTGVFLFNGNGWEPSPTIVMAGRSKPRLLLRHELVHRLVRFYLPTAPPWLNEGLADFLSTVRAAEGEAVVGAWNSWLAHSGELPELRELFDAEYSGFSARPGYYTLASSLVHLLQSERRGHRARFVAFLRQLARGVREDLAWSACFAGADLGALEEELSGYRLLAMRADRRTFPFDEPAAVAARERILRDGEVHLLWAELGDWTNLPRIEAELLQADRDLGDAPELSYWRSLAWSLKHDDARAREAIDHALALAPDEPRYLLARLRLGASPEIAARLEKVASTAGQWVQLAIFGARREPPDSREQQLARAERAAAADPACAACWSDVAEVADALGFYERAVVAMQRGSWLEPAQGEPLEWIRVRLRLAQEHGVSLPTPFDALAPPPQHTHPFGLVVRGRVQTEAGAPVAGAWVHLASTSEWEVTRTDERGAFQLSIHAGHAGRAGHAGGEAQLTVLPENPALLSDRWRFTLRPTPRPVELGSLPLVAGRLPMPPEAFDGMDPESLDGRAQVRSVDPASPAGRAGARAGERLLMVNGHDVTRLGPGAINFYLAGPAGAETTVVLSTVAGPPRTLSFRLAPTKRAPSR